MVEVSCKKEVGGQKKQKVGAEGVKVAVWGTIKIAETSKRS